MKTCTRQRLLLIDGNPLVYKAFWSTRGGKQLTTQDGRVVNTAYTFSRMILSLLRRPLWSERSACDHGVHRSTLAAVCFDNRLGARATWRSKVEPGYKAQRKPMPPALREQFPTCRDIASALGVEVVVAPRGFEADDTIAAYAEGAARLGIDTCIVSPDKDFLQLVRDVPDVLDPSGATTSTSTGTSTGSGVRPPVAAAAGAVTVFRPVQGARVGDLFRAQDVVDRYGVRPEALPLLLALAGDAADNVPGIAGVGEKTAASLLRGAGLCGVHAPLPSLVPRPVALPLAQGDRQDKAAETYASEAATVEDALDTALLKQLLEVAGGSMSTSVSNIDARDRSRLKKWAETLLDEQAALERSLHLVSLATVRSLALLPELPPLDRLRRQPMVQGSAAYESMVKTLQDLEFHSLLDELSQRGAASMLGLTA